MDSDTNAQQNRESMYIVWKFKHVGPKTKIQEASINTCTSQDKNTVHIRHKLDHKSFRSRISRQTFIQFCIEIIMERKPLKIDRKPA